MSHAMKPDLNQIDLVVRDLDTTVAFYRALGIDIPEEAIWRTASGAHHVDLTMPSGIHLHFDSPALAKAYNQGWNEPSGTGSRNVLTFGVSSREEVDRLHASLTELGHRSSQPPYDAFWGARYAIVEDPDGNHVGLMSPAEPDRRRAPPDL
jgi:predicted lactoylglutathione lyase